MCLQVVESNLQCIIKSLGLPVRRFPGYLGEQVIVRKISWIKVWLNFVVQNGCHLLRIKRRTVKITLLSI